MQLLVGSAAAAPVRQSYGVSMRVKSLAEVQDTLLLKAGGLCGQGFVVHSKRKDGRTDAKRDKRDHRLFWCPRVQFFLLQREYFQGCLLFSDSYRLCQGALGDVCKEGDQRLLFNSSNELFICLRTHSQCWTFLLFDAEPFKSSQTDLVCLSAVHRGRFTHRILMQTSCKVKNVHRVQLFIANDLYITLACVIFTIILMTTIHR